MSYLWPEAGRENEGEGAGSGRHGIHFPPTRAPTRRLAALLQSCCRLQRHYSAQETRRVETTKRRAVADSGPRDESRAQPAPPLAPHGQGLDQVRQIKMCVAPDGKNIWGTRLDGIFCTGAP
jgi:hypothetical protein